MNSLSGPIWRGTDKPAGTHFHAPDKLANLPDCPFCKFGTPNELDKDRLQCADCKTIYTKEKPHRRL